MPWEITIRRADNAPLGSMATLRPRMTAALLGIQFYMEPSGAEKIGDARAKGVEFPEVLRQHFEQRPAVEQAEFVGNGFSVRFYGFECQPILRVNAEVRGNGNPLPAIAALCLSSGWVAIDDTNGQPVDLTGESAAGWEAFTEYRDELVRKQSGEAAKASLLKAIVGDSAERK